MVGKFSLSSVYHPVFSIFFRCTITVILQTPYHDANKQTKYSLKQIDITNNLQLLTSTVSRLIKKRFVTTVPVVWHQYRALVGQENLLDVLIEVFLNKLSMWLYWTVLPTWAIVSANIGSHVWSRVRV